MKEQCGRTECVVVAVVVTGTDRRLDMGLVCLMRCKQSDLCKETEKPVGEWEEKQKTKNRVLIKAPKNFQSL